MQEYEIVRKNLVVYKDPDGGKCDGGSDKGHSCGDYGSGKKHGTK
jgi:hypothetical protein